MRLLMALFHSFSWLSNTLLALPWWLSGKECPCQRRRCRFDPWVRNVHWRGKWPLTPAFLSGKSPGQRSLLVYSPWGHNLVTKQQQQIFRCIYVYHIFVPLLMDMYVVFCVLTVVNSAALNIVMHVSFGTILLSGYMPKSGIAGSSGSSVLSFWGHLHAVFHTGSTHSHLL